MINAMLKLVALPWARLELPGYMRVLNRVAGHARVEGAPVHTIRGKLHGYRMRLDTADWSERWTYYLGRYYEAHTQALLGAALREGDTFVDIGANIGMTALVAARKVGATGRVIAFEPNPSVYERLREHIEMNDLGGRITALNQALGETHQTLTLRVPSKHTGMATFGAIRDEYAGQVTAEYQVPVVPGHEAISGALPGSMFIKIDVEGFECSVLRGLTKVLAQHRPAVMTEAVEVLLAHAGSSTKDLFALMQGAGYRGHSVEHRPGLVAAAGRPLLRRVDDPGRKHSDDVLWMVPGGEHERRLARYIV